MYRAVILLLLSGYASAHEFTPTYPKLTTSYISGINKVDMALLNRREEINYYQISAFDKDWNQVSFATMKQNNVFKVDYLDRVDFEVYFPRETDVFYVCSESKILKGNEQLTVVSSKICSKVQ